MLGRPTRGWAGPYRPERWGAFREDYRFTGKEEDREVGLVYFGKRFLNAQLGRWVSADPLAVHVPGRADANLYAYVSGAVLQAVDPVGLAVAPPAGGYPDTKLEDTWGFSKIDQLADWATEGSAWRHVVALPLAVAASLAGGAQALGESGPPDGTAVLDLMPVPGVGVVAKTLTSALAPRAAVRLEGVALKQLTSLVHRIGQAAAVRLGNSIARIAERGASLAERLAAKAGTLGAKNKSLADGLVNAAGRLGGELAPQNITGAVTDKLGEQLVNVADGVVMRHDMKVVQGLNALDEAATRITKAMDHLTNQLARGLPQDAAAATRTQLGELRGLRSELLDHKAEVKAVINEAVAAGNSGN